MLVLMYIVKMYTRHFFLGKTQRALSNDRLLQFCLSMISLNPLFQPQCTYVVPQVQPTSLNSFILPWSWCPYTLNNIVTTYSLPSPPFFDFNLLFFPLFSTVLPFSRLYFNLLNCFNQVIQIVFIFQDLLQKIKFIKILEQV